MFERAWLIGRRGVVLAGLIVTVGTGCGSNGGGVSGSGTGSSSPTSRTSSGGPGGGGAAASSSTTGVGAGSPLQVTVRPNPDNVVTAFVDITAPGAASALVVYGDTEAYDKQTPTIAIPGSGQVTTILLGVHAGQEGHAQVTASWPDGSSVATADMVFTNPPMPLSIGMPSMAITTNLVADGRYVLSALTNQTAGGHVAVMLDRNARPMWYRPGTGGFGTVFARMPNGNFAFYNVLQMRVDEIALDGTIVRQWIAPDTVSERGVDHHEFTYVPATDHAYVIGGETHPSDWPGASASGVRLDDNLLELDGFGGARKIWSSFTEITYADHTSPSNVPIDPDAYIPAHANSIEVMPDGSLLFSCREVSTVFKIDPVTGQTIWRLGGKHSDFTFLGDPLGNSFPLGTFTMQHDVRLTPEGHIRLVDNGNMHNPPETRVVEYAIDEVAMTATYVRSFKHNPALFSRICGSARLLGSGNVMADFAEPGTFSEYDPSGNLVWELKPSSNGAYRAEVVDTLYP